MAMLPCYVGLELFETGQVPLDGLSASLSGTA